MASADKVKIVTGRGELWFVNIAGQGKKNYNEDGFEYTATLRVPKDSDTAKDLKAKIDAYYAENNGGNKKLDCRSLGYRPVMEKTGEDKDGDPIYKETNLLDFQFKTKTVFTDKEGKEQTKVIGVFNASAEKVSLKGKKVGNGSIGAISGTASYYSDGKKEDGVSLYLNNIQLFKFIEYTDNGGFTKAEGEFSGVAEEENDFVGEKEEPEEKEVKTSAKPRL